MARAFSKSQVPIWFHTVFSSSQSSVFHKVSDFALLRQKREHQHGDSSG